MTGVTAPTAVTAPRERGGVKSAVPLEGIMGLRPGEQRPGAGAAAQRRQKQKGTACLSTTRLHQACCRSLQVGQHIPKSKFWG